MYTEPMKGKKRLPNGKKRMAGNSLVQIFGGKPCLVFASWALVRAARSIHANSKYRHTRVQKNHHTRFQKYHHTFEFKIQSRFGFLIYTHAGRATNHHTSQ